jgi:hypothetical protein
VNERELRKLRAAAEHERHVALLAAEAVERTERKVERAQADLEAAEDALATARLKASDAEQRAQEAERAATGLEPGGVTGEMVTANAGTAAGKAGV